MALTAEAWDTVAATAAATEVGWVVAMAATVTCSNSNSRRQIQTQTPSTNSTSEEIFSRQLVSTFKSDDVSSFCLIAGGLNASLGLAYGIAQMANLGSTSC